MGLKSYICSKVNKYNQITLNVAAASKDVGAPSKLLVFLFYFQIKFVKLKIKIKSVIFFC